MWIFGINTYCVYLLGLFVFIMYFFASIKQYSLDAQITNVTSNVHAA